MSRIALLDHLHTDTPVSLNIPLKEGGQERREATARIVDKEGRIVIAQLKGRDVLQSEQIDFRKKCSVILEGEGPALSMNATIEEVLGRNKFLLKGSDYIPYEPKRNAFRVDAELPVQYRRYYREKESFRQVKSGDISSGGVRILCSEKLQPGDTLLVSLEIPSPREGTVLCTAQVMWSRGTPNGNLEAGCQFLDLEEESEDLIIAFCFERQRELMKERVETANR